MLRSSIIVSLLSLALSIVSFVNQLLIAQLFGASIQLDNYLVAVSLPMLFSGLTAGLISYLLVPVLVRYQLSASDFGRFSTRILVILAFSGIVVAVVFALVSPLLLSAMSGGVPASAGSEIVHIAQISWISFGVSVVVNYLSAAYNARKRFFVPVIVSSLPYFGMIAAGLWLGTRIGLTALAYGQLAGFAVSALVLIAGSLRDLSLDLGTGTGWRSVFLVFKPVPLVLISMLCFTVYGSIDAFWAPRLGPSSLSYLAYAQRLLIALGGIISHGPITVILPYLSETVARRDEVQFRASTMRVVRMIITFASPFALTAATLSVSTVRLLFERGAFDRSATVGLAGILPGMFTGMIAMLSVVVLFRALYAKQDIRGAAIIGATGAVLYFTLSGILSASFGIMGIVTAYIVTWTVLLAISMQRIWRQHSSEIFARDNGVFLVNLFLGLSTSAICVALVLQWLPVANEDIGWWELAVHTIIVGGIGIGSFFFVTGIVLRMSEVSQVLTAFIPRGITRRVLGHS